MKLNLVIVALLLAGIMLMAYPPINRSIQEHKQNRLLTEWSMARTAPQSQSGAPGNSVVPMPLTDTAAGTDTNKAKPAYNGLELMGTVEIPVIEAYEPILPDATDKSLKVGVGSVVSGPAPGEAGNFVLAGHRSFTYGKQFSRLNELKENDEVIVESAEGRYVYQVSESFLVEPDDLTVLEQNDQVRELTLITCHPVRNPTHRLIVKAVLKS